MKLFIPDDGSGNIGGSAPASGGSAVADPAATPATEQITARSEPPASLIPPSAEPATPAPGALGDEWINEDGSFRQGWYQRFPEEMQVPLARYKSVEELAKGHANAQALIGRKGVFIPTEKSTPQEVADFRKAVGVPETAEAYQIKPDTLPEGMVWNDELAKPFLAVAHKHNVSQAALKELSSAFAQMESMKGQHMIATAQANFQEELREGTATLQARWREDFDRNILKAQRAAALVGVDPKRAGFRDPEVVAGFVRLADMISEDKLVGATGGLQPTMSGLAMAKDIVNNPQNPRHHLYHSGDPDTQAIVREYFKQGSKKA